MFGFRLQAERPPEPRPVADGVVMRLDDVYEIDPSRMQIIRQQGMPVSDTLRIVASRWEHLSGSTITGLTTFYPPRRNRGAIRAVG